MSENRTDYRNSFVEVFNNLPFDRLREIASRATEADVRRCLSRDALRIEDFACLISDAGERMLDQLCARSMQLTRRRFGRVIRLFAPLYLSNECINNCKYCGFSRDNPILRLTLSVEEVVAEARVLHEQGFRNILLVSGEHPKFVTNGYMEECIRKLREFIPTVALEIGPMESPDYKPLVRAGAEGLVVYQETYDLPTYREMHTAGPKKDFDWRLATPERAYDAGFRRLGIGALFGLADWQSEAFSLAAHSHFLLNRCWKSSLTVSFPRLRPCAGDFQPRHILSDRKLVQLVAAFRMFLPDLGIVLSTREPSQLRDGLMPLGITHASAGSHTEPGGYSGAGRQNLHQTVRGRQLALSHENDPAPADPGHPSGATGQFDIADHRAPGEVARFLQTIGYEPVWKDWDFALGE
jgi:2-iminoacetate synthase